MFLLGGLYDADFIWFYMKNIYRNLILPLNGWQYC